MEKENMDLRMRNILKRVRKIWTEDAINIAIDYWHFTPEDKIKIEYAIWISILQEHSNFKSISEIEEWLYKKELLLKKF